MLNYQKLKDLSIGFPSPRRNGISFRNYNLRKRMNARVESKSNLIPDNRL